jgi:hypothetical protein
MPPTFSVAACGGLGESEDLAELLVERGEIGDQLDSG